MPLSWVFNGSIIVANGMATNHESLWHCPKEWGLEKNDKEQNAMSLEYIAAVAWLYEQVMCQLKMGSGFSKYFLSNMGSIKVVHSLSHFLVYASIVNKATKGEGVDGQNSCSSLFLYSYMLMLCILIYFEWYETFDVLEIFCQINKLIVNMDTTKMMATQPRHYYTFTYEGESIQLVQSFKFSCW